MGGSVQRLDSGAHGPERADGPRTFLRRFIEATNVPPGQWLIAERVADAQRPLESSSKTARCQSRTSPGGVWQRAGPAAALSRQTGTGATGLSQHVLRSPHALWPGCSSARDMMLMEPTHNP